MLNLIKNELINLCHDYTCYFTFYLNYVYI